MSTIKSSTTLTTAYSVTADTTGTLVFQTGATPTTALTIDASQAVTFAGAVSLSGNQTTTGNLTVNGNTTLGDASTDTILMTGAPSIGGAGLGMGMGFRNRIINGAMVIDQRNAGAAVVSNNSGQYPIDRFIVEAYGGGVLTTQQSTTVPAGFLNSLLITVTTTDTSLGTTDDYEFSQKIEGFNVFDLGWGTANAQTVTLSFWVRSSVATTYSVGFQNSDASRSYVGTYTINSANTWEQKTITVAGDTSGTWNKGNSTGLFIRWCLATGTNRIASVANTWESANRIAISATANPIMGTSGATFNITGVQLEKGSTATSFDYRPYGTELALCQRYLPMFTFGASEKLITGQAISTTQVITTFLFPVTARSVATGVTSSAGSNFALGDATLGYGANQTGTAIAFETGGVNQASVKLTCTSGLVAGNASIVLSRFANTTIQFTGCEL